MNERRINETICYIEGSARPLSADIGMVQEEQGCWLYDVGNDERAIASLNGCYSVVLSHFHPDHIGNIGKLRVNDLYLSKETLTHIPEDILASCRVHPVDAPVHVGKLHIFPLPSSHAKGSLGLEVDGQYAFVGDALYCRAKGHAYIYNAQLLKEELDVLKQLTAPFLLVSHFKGLVRKREEVLQELEAIYAKRTSGSPDIPIE